MSDHHGILSGIYIIFGLGILSQWISWRLRVPAIIPLLISGFLIGPIFGVINSRELLGDLFLPFVEALVPFIVFEGALGLKLQDIKISGKPIFLLSSVGVLLTFSMLSLASYYILQLSPNMAILLGALLVITGPTVIIPMLRQIRIKASLASIIRWEGILIEPVGVLLVSLVYQMLFMEVFSVVTLIVIVSKTIFFGSLIGIVFSSCIVFLFDRHYLPEYLHEAFVLSSVLISFLLADTFQSGAGLVTVVIMGILLVNQKKVHFDHVVLFKENLRVLVISTLFVIIASSLTLETLKTFSDIKVVFFLLFAILIARPLAVFISCFKSGLNTKEKLFLSWIAPRGIITAATASLFSLQLIEQGVTEAEALVPLTFFVIVSTVAVYGLSAGFVQTLLKLEKGSGGYMVILGSNTFSRQLSLVLMKYKIKVLIVDTDKKNIEKAKFQNIKSFHRNIFSFHLWEELQKLGVNSFFALTASDEINALSTIKYSEFLESNNVYRLYPASLENLNSKNILSLDKVKVLFDSKLSFPQIENFLNTGYNLFSKIIENENTFSQIKKEYGEIKLLFSISYNKKLKVFHSNKELVPKIQDVVIFLGKS